MTLTASTGARISVRREADLFHAQLVDVAESMQVCLAVDLFEVIAELAGLDLENTDQAAEAISLADAACREPADDPALDPGLDKDDDGELYVTDTVS